MLACSCSASQKVRSLAFSRACRHSSLPSALPHWFHGLRPCAVSLNLAFAHDEPAWSPLGTFHFFVYLYFLTDVVLTFRTGYHTTLGERQCLGLECLARNGFSRHRCKHLFLGLVLAFHHRYCSSTDAAVCHCVCFRLHGRSMADCGQISQRSVSSLVKS